LFFATSLSPLNADPSPRDGKISFYSMAKKPEITKVDGLASVEWVLSGFKMV